MDQYILNTRTDVLSPQAMRIRIMLRDRQEKLARAAATQVAAASTASGTLNPSLEVQTNAVGP